ncbi:PREDICTED: uncharacterized protein LOC109183945 [Ipomoea nil]|uniref:uncharacterized protein LOC109183945 n=1 Tax=Ipomoea nil TaxID=35883 RepID=UPI000900D551|nr:PREDICTED: uncharacterized protein LOC109183945 [Ipomoea nil]
MVSEPPRFTYAVAVTGSGETSRRAHSMQPTQQPPIQNASMGDQQRNLASQRSSGVDDIENPLHLNINENPSAILVSPPLSGSANYASWSISMQVALEVKNKWGIVDGSLSPPERTNALYPPWRRCNLMRRFSQRDAHRISFLQNDINNLTQGDMSINDYYTKCQTLWEEMNTLRPLPICKCQPRCSCDLLDQIRLDREIDHVIRFLQGLNEEYNTLKSRILVLDPLPEMHKVLVMAEKHERQLIVTNLSSGNLSFTHANAVHTGQNNEEEMAAVVNFSNFSNGRRVTQSGGNNRNLARCTFCGMTGHTIEKCYKKHGYPPGWVPDSEYSLLNSKPNGAEQVQHISSCISGPNFNKENSNTEGKYTDLMHINSAYLNSYAWIIDSGATDHIVCSLEFFDNYRTVSEAKVNLPNGNHATVEHIGNIKLSNDIWLKDVLHIPSFKFNIISIHKLLQNSAYSLMFTYGQCLLREDHGRMIGFAKEE